MNNGSHKSFGKRFWAAQAFRPAIKLGNEGALAPEIRFQQSPDETASRKRPLSMKNLSKYVSALIAIFLLASAAHAQTDWIRTGTGLGVEKVRLAAANFKS